MRDSRRPTPGHLCGASLCALAILTAPATALAASEQLPSKMIFVVAGNIIFFSILISIWIAAKMWPRFEAKQRARAEQRQAELDGHAPAETTGDTSA